MTTTPRIDLSEHLTPETHRALIRVAHEVGVDYDDVSDCRCLCWLIEVLKHIKDNRNNFPAGKFHTIRTLEKIASETAGQIARIYYGNV